MRHALAALLLAVPAAAQPVPCRDGLAGTFPCEHVDLLSHLDLDVLDAEAGSGHWGWTDPETGQEYALMGLSNGTAFVDVTDPERPRYLGKLPTHTVPSLWREIKVLHHWALVVSEAPGHGMQIFDLRRLRTVDPNQGLVTFEADAHYGEETGIGQSHNVAANPDTDRAFIVGSRAPNGCAGGIHVVDLQEPRAPRFAGCFAEDGYTHDLVCLTYDGPDTRYTGREICVASNEDVVTIVDTTDPKRPRLLGQAIYPYIGYTHQGWFTEDRRFFVLNDEFDEMRYGFPTRTLLFDLADLENPRFVGDHHGPTRAVAHNLYVRGDLVYMANYRRGLEIARIDDAATAALTNIAFFDSFPEDDATQFGGAWNVYPFYASGTVTIADMNRGLFMVRPYRPEPLALTTLVADPDGAGAVVTWTVAEADPPSWFAVQRLAGETFSDAGHLAGDPASRTHRLHLALPPGEHVLRVRAVDRSGLSLYSEAVSVRVPGTP